MKLLSGEFHGIASMLRQHRFRLWLGAVRQQIITQANVDTRPQWVNRIGQIYVGQNNWIYSVISLEISGLFYRMHTNPHLFNNYCKLLFHVNNITCSALSSQIRINPHQLAKRTLCKTQYIIVYFNRTLSERVVVHHHIFERNSSKCWIIRWSLLLFYVFIL